MVTEKEIRGAVKRYLQLSGWFVFPIAQGMYSMPGISDYIAIKDGLVIFVEIKSPTGKQSDPQIRFQQNIEDRGGVYIIARCIEDVEDVIYQHTGERSLLGMFG